MENHINTNGGANVGRDIETGGGAFVNRDQHILNNQTLVVLIQQEDRSFNEHSRPISKIIETVRSFIGVNKSTKGSTDNSIILPESLSAHQEFENRAFKRWGDQELRRQKNIESITDKAINFLPSRVSSTPVEEDWIYDFYERSKDISNEQMQELWARILAGEVAKPGSFSKRTLETVKTLSANEAKLFMNCGRFVWNRPTTKDEPILIIPDINRTAHIHFYAYIGLDVAGFHILQSAGLIILGKFAIASTSSECHIEYCNNRYKLTLLETMHGFKFSTGAASFTAAGEEILRILKTEPDHDYEQHVINFWQTRGIGVEKI